MTKFSEMIDFEAFLAANVKPVYRASAREAAHSVTQTRDKYSRIIKPHVSPHWPLRGSLRFTRERDGQCFEIVSKRGAWVCRKA